MKSFLEEYGFAILAAIVIILLIAMASPLGDIIRTQLSNIVNKFANSANKKLDAADAGDATAVLTDTKLTVFASSTTDKFTAILHGVQGGKAVAVANAGSEGKDLTCAASMSEEKDVSHGTNSVGGTTGTVEFNVAIKTTGSDPKLLLDSGSEYYVEVKNEGTGEVFYSNRLIAK